MNQSHAAAKGHGEVNEMMHDEPFLFKVCQS